MKRRATRKGDLLVPADVNLGAPRVVHCMREPHHVCIDRTTKWGNPFVLGMHGDRDEVIGKYELWLYESEPLMNSLGELKGMVLGCWCAPPRLPRRRAAATGK